jgi:hypothetical protein
MNNTESRSDGLDGGDIRPSQHRKTRLTGEAACFHVHHAILSFHQSIIISEVSRHVYGTAHVGSRSIQHAARETR